MRFLNRARAPSRLLKGKRHMVGKTRERTARSEGLQQHINRVMTAGILADALSWVVFFSFRAPNTFGARDLTNILRRRSRDLSVRAGLAFVSAGLRLRQVRSR